MPQQQINLNLTLKDISSILCESCKEKLLHLAAEKTHDEAIKKTVDQYYEEFKKQIAP